MLGKSLPNPLDTRPIPWFNGGMSTTQSPIRIDPAHHGVCSVCRQPADLEASRKIAANAWTVTMWCLDCAPGDVMAAFDRTMTELDADI